MELSLSERAVLSEVTMDDPRATIRASARPVAPHVALALVLIAFVVMLALHHAPAISQPDDNGYFAQGTLLAQTGHTWFRPASDAQYIGMHWLLTPDGNYVSRYPPGLAVLIAGVYGVFGYRAATFVNPALSLISLVGAFATSARLGLSRWAALGVVAVLAANPIFVDHALAGDSHMAVTAALTWGLFLLMGWSRDGKPQQLFFAALVLGLVPTIRYPDAIIAGAVAIFVLSHWHKHKPMGRQLTFAAAGVAVPVLPLMIRNQLLLGGFWKTGYALTNEQTGFSFDYFRQHALQYIQQIHAGGLGLFFALGVAGIAYMIATRERRALGLMLALITLPMLLLYMAYYWAPNQAGATMRFLLPTFPAHVIAGAWMLAQLTKLAPRGARIAVPCAIIAVQLLWAGQDYVQAAQRVGQTNRGIAMVTDAIERTAKPGDVIVADNQMLQNLDFVRQWKLADPSVIGNGGGGPGGGGPVGGGGPGMGGPGGGFGGGPGMGGPMMGGPGGGPIGGGPGMGGGPDGMGGGDQPSPMQAEKRAAQRALYPGTAEEKSDKFVADLRKWAGDSGSIWLVGTSYQVNRYLGDAVSWDEIKIVTKLTVPMGGGPGMGGPMGGGPGGGQRGGFGQRGPGGGMNGGGAMLGGNMRGGDRRGGGQMNAGPQTREVVIAKWTPRGV